MEVTGKHHPFSTPESRMDARIKAERLGDLQNFLAAPPFRIAGVLMGLAAAGFIEKIHIPL